MLILLSRFFVIAIAIGGQLYADDASLIQERALNGDCQQPTQSSSPKEAAKNPPIPKKTNDEDVNAPATSSYPKGN